ncbi:MAG: hypothetical protein JO264_05210 [Acidisphaera sp.]|nr:hypothetical protein [Acidisphaera sp.]
MSVRTEDLSEDREQIAKFNFTYQQRKGVFLNFIRQDRFHRTFGRDFNVFAGRLVPAFMIMDQEIRYRIFEKQNVLSIMQSCMDDFKGVNLKNYLSMPHLNADDFPKMEHCVQYGESTFNFLSRLMNRFSIWYYFDHDGAGDLETMVLAKGTVKPTPADKSQDWEGQDFQKTTGFKACSVFNNHPDPRSLFDQGSIQDWEIIFGLTRTYTPAPRLARTGDFNTVLPTQPLQSVDEARTEVDKDHDIINSPADTVGPTTSFVQEVWPDSGIDSNKDATDDAMTSIEVAQGQVFTVSATTKNPSFYAAKVFCYLKGDDNPKSTNYLITRMSLNAYDRDYVYVVSRKGFFGLEALVDDIFGPAAGFANQVTSLQQPNLAVSMAAAGLAEYQNAPSSNKPGFGSWFADGAIGFLSAYMPNMTGVLQDLLPILNTIITGLSYIVKGVVDVVLLIPDLIARLFHHKTLLSDVNNAITKFTNGVENFLKHLLKSVDADACGVSFVATPLDRGNFAPPLPTARPAQIFGPHLATVIGENGIAQKGTLYADKLGRIRVRFPWDRAPPGAAADGSQDAPQFLVGNNTAWLFVGDAWGGAQFGAQFLPRVGDEVVVSFVDGDPDRPIVTGRVYHVDSSGDSNLPFPDKTDTKKVNKMSDLMDLTGGPNLTRSGVRTRIFGQKDKNTKFHLLRFDDDPKHPQTLIRSQGRLDVTAFGSHFETTGGDRHQIVGGKDPQTGETSGDSKAKVWGEYDLHIVKDRYELVEKGYQLEVTKDINLKVDGNWGTSVGGRLTAAADTIVYYAQKKIVLTVGDTSFISIEPGGIYVSGPMIYKNSGGSCESAGAVTMSPLHEPSAADPGNP